MFVYWIILGVFSICVIGNCTNISARSKDIMYWVCAASLIILSAIRDFSVGPDTINYCNGFENIRQVSFGKALQFGWEQGYVAVNWLLGRFFEGSRALVVFMAMAILIPFFLWIKKESAWPILSLIVFVCTGMWSSSMFILRQWCAMATLTFSYRYIKKREFIPFVVLVLIAALFHRTAVIFVLAYFICCIPLNRTTIIAAVPVSAMIGLLGGRILNVLNRFARITETGNFNGGISLLVVLWLCVFAILICFNGCIPKQLDFYFRFVFLAALLQPVAFTFSNWSRIIAYFSVSLSVLLPNSIVELTSFKTNNQSLRLPLGVAVCALMMIWFQMINIDPYIFMQI